MNRRGQATIEYVLLLAIVLIVSIGTIYSFNDGFKNFLKNYFGEYTQCLIETGELPSFGGSTTLTCDESFAPYTIGSGRPPVTLNGKPVSGGPSTGGGGTGSGGGGGIPTADQKIASGGARSEIGGFQFNNSGGGGGSRNGAFEGGGFGPQGGSAGGSVVPLSKADTGAGGSGAEQFETFNGKDRFASMNSGKQKPIPLAKGEEVQKTGIDNKKIPASITDQKEQARRVPADFSNKPKPVVDEDPEWTIGSFMKYILIAAIILAMVFFLGGQALQISKSGEK